MTDSQLLADRAQDYLRQILQVANGPGGLLISHVRFDTRRPFQEGQPLSPYMTQVIDSVWGGVSPKPTFADWYYGENTLWATVRPKRWKSPANASATLTTFST
jgi:hypothetical protein